MNPRTTVQSEKTDSGRAGLKAVFALLVLLGTMVASYFYPYPSGERPSFLSFLTLWGREAVIVVAVLVFLVVLAVATIVRAVRKRRRIDD